MIRKLEKKDFREFIDLVNYFTRDVKKVKFEDFEKYYDKIQNDFSKIFIIEEDNKIIATGKILIEYKFHNNLSKTGHIEDVVVNENCRGKGYGKKIIKYLINVAEKEKCYKVILCSSLKNSGFYENCGLKKKDIEMCKYFF